MKTAIAALALSLAAFDAAAACTRQTGLSCPAGSASATLTSNCTASDSSYYDLWQFTGITGDVVTIRMTSAAFDAYLILLNPSDVAVTDNDDGGDGTTNAVIRYTLPATGTWTIVANSIGANKTGAYTLSLTCGTQSTPACTYDVAGPAGTTAAAGGTGAIAVTTSSSCAWTASSDVSWITITSGTSVTGSGSVAYQVSANPATAQRQGTLQIAGKTVTVTQDAAAPPPRRRAVAH